jgi:hypothetical protein
MNLNPISYYNPIIAPSWLKSYVPLRWMEPHGRGTLPAPEVINSNTAIKHFDRIHATLHSDEPVPSGQASLTKKKGTKQIMWVQTRFVN